jgi:hypothetical protein
MLALRPLLCLSALLAALALRAAATEGVQVVAGVDEPVPVPSGQSVTLQDVIWNAPGTDGMALRFRFVAPGIAPGGGVDFDAASTDMQHLCDTYALARLAEFGPAPEQVVISLSDRAVAFGDAAPDVTQFFESYRIENGVCVWEMF